MKSVLRCVAAWGKPILFAFMLSVICSTQTFGALTFAINNPDFESGTLEGWTASQDYLTIEVSTNESFNRYHAARIHGSYTAARWITNRLSQSFTMNAGDVMSAIGFVWWKTNVTSSSAARGELDVRFAGPINTTTNIWTNSTTGWVYFEIYGGLAGVMNGGFEAGSYENWMHGADDLHTAVVRDDVPEGQYALRFYGGWTNKWSWNHVSQGMMLSSGELVMASAKIKVAQLTKSGGWAVAGIKFEDNFGNTLTERAFQATTNTAGWVTLSFSQMVTNDGFYIFRCFVCGDASGGKSVQADVYFDDARAQRKAVNAENGDFELSNLDPWSVDTANLTATVSTTRAYSGACSMRMSGSWTNWGWNQAVQGFYLPSGATVRMDGKLYLQTFTNTSGWAVAGLKLERQGGGGAFERTYDRTATKGQWLDLGLTAQITNAGIYDFRCMVCGNVGSGTANADVYFDAVSIRVDGAPTNYPVKAELQITYRGYSGDAASTSRVDIYVDSIMMKGSSAGSQPAYVGYQALRDRAAAVASNPSENDIAPVPYPPLYAYGYPGGSSNPVIYPAVAEVGIPSWRFRYFTNDLSLTLTNIVILGALGNPGYIEVDQYRYLGKSWQTERGMPLDLQTNTPYFALGIRDGRSDEFGSGPFEATHRYVVGTSLTNFPRRLVSVYDGQWPTRLEIVFTENLKTYDRVYDKYFAIYGVTTNGSATGTKSAWIELHGYDPILGSNLYIRSQEIHMGWGDETITRGMVDYPNCTYQDHNNVGVRAAWHYNLINRDEWFVQQVPRGSATIEPLDVYLWESGKWTYRAYEEYLFTWPSAASGVRSVFDDDTIDAVPGPASYFVGYRIGHRYGTNEFGEPTYISFIENRGNGYFRATDYGGVMGGSFRPVSMDVFGLYQNREDAPVMPETYLSLVSRSTPTNAAWDDSYVQAAAYVRSKTNQWIVGAMNFEGHYVPVTTSNGVYFDLEMDLYANRAVTRQEHGFMNIFAQVDMFWRGNPDIDQGDEAHDVDAIVLNKSDGEWITHYPVNPPTNVYHRSLGTFASNDVLYIMQQDRSEGSYGFNPEAPYRKVSSMEIEMLDDGSRPIRLDVYEQNTISEINDNVVIAGAVDEDLAKGARVHARYRYRTVYGPGVTIVSPNTPDGGDNWSNNAYRIEVIAVDGDDRPLRLDLYYGNGRADDWKLINTNEVLTVPTATDRLTYWWNVSAVPSGAYYIKAVARRLDGEGRPGFDVSDARLQVGRTIGLPNNVPPETQVITNEYGLLGTNMSFETGDMHGWTLWPDHLKISASAVRSWDGMYACRMTGRWVFVGYSNLWSWNTALQEIPCVSGEILRVQGRIYIGALQKGGTNWLRCGIKMESTNDQGRTQAGQEFDAAYTGSWIAVDFYRTAPVTGTDRLLLWVAGYDATACDVFFDDIKVMSTNHGTVVTNETREGYWASATPINASDTDVLAFHVAMEDPDPGLRVWVADAGGTTNYTLVTNFLSQLTAVPQYVAVPWSAFPSVNRTQVMAMGFFSPLEKMPQISGARFTKWPILVSSAFPYAPATNAFGLAHYNPGQDVIQVIAISNHSASALNNVRIQLIQEYGETTYWWDDSHSPALWNVRTRRGDRLCGSFERNWTNLNIPAGGVITLTNVYRVPEGRLIDHTKWAIPTDRDWYAFRNYAALAQSRVVVRTATSGTISEQVAPALYSLDDDYDMDNDGLPDAWERQYGGCDTCMHPGADPDSDGYTNLEEYQAGSDPTDPTSYPGHISSYVLHLAYTNGVDLFPQATAEQSNYTAAACAWMIARYLNGSSFTQSQSQIYAACTPSPDHNDELTPASVANWMYYNAPPQYYFAARYRMTLADALKESVYWMDYRPPGGLKTPVYIVCNTNWSYKVIRGFETDRAPYDGGYYVTTGNVFTIYGLWINDPAIGGLGYDVFVSASQMSNIYLPSESDGRFWLVAEPPKDADTLAAIEAKMNATALQWPEEETHPELAAALRAAALGFEPPARKAKLWSSSEGYDIYGILPNTLREDAAFMDAYAAATVTNCYIVNFGEPEKEYILAAGGERGPATTRFVVKLGTNGAFHAAAWSREPVLYPAVSYEAAKWLAFKQMGLGGVQDVSLLSNGGFEQNSGGEQPVTPTGWTRGEAAGSYSWGAHAGTWSMAVAGWLGTTYGYFYQDMSLASDNRPYTFGIWMQRDAAFTASTIELKLEWYNASMTKLGEVATNVAAQVDTTYRFFRVDGTSPANTRTVRCTVWCSGFSYNEGALKCDDAVLISATNRALACDARLVFDPYVDVSVFLPRWELTISLPTGTTITTVGMLRQNLDGDTDGDGMSDRHELYVGLDPENPVSAFYCDAARATAPTGIVLRWPSVAGRTYSIWSATNAAGFWNRHRAGLPATPPINEVVEPVPSPRAYYRVEAE